MDDFQFLIIGYGNTLRSDDGFGSHVAEALIECGNLTHTEIVAAQQLTPEMVETLQKVELVIFIDINIALAPGEIQEQNITADDQLPTGFSHHLDPSRLLALCYSIYGHAPQAVLFSAGADHFELGETLTPKLHAALNQVVNDIEKLIVNQQNRKEKNEQNSKPS